MIIVFIDQMLDIKQVLKVAVLAGFSTLLVIKVKKLIQTINDREELAKAQPKQLKDILVSIKESKHKNRMNLIKLQPYYFQQISYRRPVRSLEKYVFEPQDIHLVTQIQDFLSKPFYYWDRNKKPRKWFAQIQSNDQRPIIQRDHAQINGFGKVVGDFFALQREYKPIKKLGYWSRFRNWIIQSLFKRRKYLMERSKVNGQAYGPIIGHLQYKIDLLRSVFILAICDIQEGIITPQATACAKEELISYYDSLVRFKYFEVGAYLVISIIIGRWLWSDLKTFFNSLKARRQRLSGSYFNPKDQISEDKTCIICYTNCRNVIFFDCRHMIMCRQCSQTYNSDVCPLCKDEIDDIKIVKGVK